MFKRVFAGATVVATVLALAACGSGEPPTGIQMPSSANDFEGQPYDEVVDALEDAGFTDVEAVPMGDLITGWLTDEFSVDEVAVDGDTIFTSDDYFDADSKIIVNYHSFPEDEEAEEEESEPEPSAEPSEAAPATLTPENNGDLAALLTTTDYCGANVVAFATMYEGQNIEFDANIGAMNNHGGYNTRYDILIGSGNYDPNTQPGPAFQFRDVNIVSDLKLAGDNVPDTIGVGQNLNVTAKVVGFEESSCLFLLDPVLTLVR